MDEGAVDGKTKILVVDDEEAILFALSRTLGGPGISVETASTPDEAGEKLSGRDGYAAVILDLRLSGSEEMEGLDILHRVKTEHPNTRAIVVTAYANQHMRERVFAEHADFCLEKPVSGQQLRQVLWSLGVYESG